MVLVAERAGMSRVTLHRIEKGDPAVTFGNYLRVLMVRGLERDVDLDARDEVPAFFLEHYRRVGFSEQALDAIRARGYDNFARSVTPIPEEYRRIQDGETIEIGGREWRVIVGYGHAPEHACLSARIDQTIAHERGGRTDGREPEARPAIGNRPHERA